jgi:hypothetical protein
MNIKNGFLNDVVKRLETYKTLGDKTFEQLDEKDFFFRASEESNSISTIIKHLHGNMLSRFTNFLTEDGEKTWRKRDEEFDEEEASKSELMKRWNEGWDCVFAALKNMKEDDLEKIIYIRTEPLTAYDAILRQLAHYPYHVGQIVFIGKMLKDKNWHSLSIARGKSNDFNEKMKQHH